MELQETEIKQYLEQAINDIIEIMKIRSVADEPVKDAPFGLETRNALDYALNLAKKMGFKAVWGHNFEYGYADFGTGKKLFGIICHLDVVPSGDMTKWLKSPWDPIIENGELYGRGSLDDKGPTIINMYALKYLKDHGFNPKEYTIRLIFGLTEETTWESINSYLKHEKTPDLAYTPDGEWPVIYAEKTILNFDIIGPGVKNLNLFGGEAYNVVCDLTHVELPFEFYNEFIKTLKSFNFEYVEDKNFLVNVKGKAAHGSIPETGINAAINSLIALKQIGFKIPVAEFVFNNFKNANYEFPDVFPNFKDETGVVSANVGKLRINEREQRVGFDCRIPVTYTKEQITDAINTAVSKYPELKWEVKAWENAKYVPQDSAFIQQLMKVYKDVTGDTGAKPLAIGGGTYARAMDNCIAFGACREMELMHNVNERIKLTELEDMLKIYIKSIYSLVK